jgi:serine/threonine-protein kinase
MSFAPGAWIGPFQVNGLLGAGGMGQVYRARDSRLNRDVAIKVLPLEFATDPERMARFSREAQALAALSHPNIAAIYGLEETGGNSALVMELVEGQTLAERLRGGPIPVDEAIGIARQIAEALEAAHEKGIIHRDLKPANIKITPEGKVKVLDFGLAKAMDTGSTAGGLPADSPTVTVESTRAGVILGTAAYMSPEQARGKAVDKRADIWAFGVVFYEMLTGRAMFEGETAGEILAAVLRAEIDLKNLPVDTPPNITRLLNRCLQRDPKQRLRDIGDARIEIDGPVEAAPLMAARVRRSTLWLPWIAAGAIIAAALSWALFRLASPVPARPVMRWEWPNPKMNFLAVSRDGSRIAYAEELGPGVHVGVRKLDELEGRPIPGAEGGVFPVFSPDGQWVLYTSPRDNKIKKVPVAGGPAITVCDRFVIGDAAWGEDDIILFSNGTSLFRVQASGGSPERVTTPDPKNGETSHRYPQFLPGSKQAIFSIASGGSFEHAKVGLLDVRHGTYRVIANGGARTRYTPSGHLVYFRSGSLFAMPFDLRRMAVTGSETPVVNGISTLGPQGYADYSFSNTGLMVYVARFEAGGTSFAWVDKNGTVRPITSTLQPWGGGRLSSDGNRIANITANPSEDGDVWLVDARRGTTTRLTFDGGAQHPIWSPDGRRILYKSSKEGMAGIYSVSPDGTGRPELVLATKTIAIPQSMTPDGRTMIYSELSDDSRIRLLAITGGSSPVVLHVGGQDAELSPDGKWLAYGAFDSGGQEIYVQPFPGPGPRVRVSLQGGIWPRWSRDMDELFYWEGVPPARLMSVTVHAGPEFSVSVPKQVLHKLVLHKEVGSTWDVAPDGKHFLIELADPDKATGGKVTVVTEWFDELRRLAPPKR